MKKNVYSPWRDHTSWRKKVFNVMRISMVLLFMSLITASATNSLAQSNKVTISLNNVTLSKVFDEIESQTTYNFFYKKDALNDQKLVSISANKEEVADVLERLLVKESVSYKLVDNSIVIIPALANAVQQAEKNVNGNVKDQSGSPIPGATVLIKGSGTGTITDVNGNFVLNNVSEGATLLISFIGMKTEEVVFTGIDNLYIILQEEQLGIDEVVVVGYGTQKRGHITGSVAQVAAKEIAKTPQTNVSSALVGKLPGLISRQSSGQPGGDAATLLIRGAGTFNNSSPLILVDGIERPFNSVDPNDIASVTILKDASASAVYGVRAAHGVILVETKRGKKGDRSSISYTGSYTVTANTRFPKLLDAPDYAYWHNTARELDGDLGYYSRDDVEKMKNGDPDGVLGNTDWENALFRDFGTIEQHNISASGGKDNVQYFVSGGVMVQEGIIPNNNYERFNLRSNLDVQITDDIKLLVAIAGRKEDRYNPGFSMSPNSSYSPITAAIRALPVVPQEYQGLPTATGPGFFTYNPVAAVQNSGFNKTNNYRFESGTTLQYTAPFLKGLEAKFFFAYDHSFFELRNYLDSYQVNKFNPVYKSYTQVRAAGTAEKASLRHATSNGSKRVIRPSISYRNRFGKHELGALFLYEFTETASSDLEATRRDFLLSTIPELTFGQEDVPNSIRGGSGLTQVAGYVGRLNYAFDDKYLAEIAFRYDGSYKFHEDYRWGLFPSVSLGWRLSETQFVKEHMPQISNLKLRLSAGELGADNVDAFMYKRFFGITNTPAYALGVNTVPSYVLYTTNSVPSYNLTWEKTRTINGGFEVSAWNGLLSAELDVFYKYTYDILQGVSGVYPPSISDNYPTIENSGEVDSRGFELLLGHRNRINNVTYGLTGNVSWARNKLLKRTQQEGIQAWKNQIGQPLGGVYGFKTLGLYQTEEELINRPIGPNGIQRLGDIRYEDFNGDGKIDWEDQQRIARSPLPELIFSLGGDMQYKGFDFSFQLQGAAICDVMLGSYYPGGIMDMTEFSKPFYGDGNAPYYLVENSWTPENTDAEYPRLGVAVNTNNYWTSDWWVRDGAYLRLKQLTVGYTVPKVLTAKARIEALRLYVSGTNLFTLDNLTYLDPEMPSSNNGYYPQQKTFSLGLNLTF